jgi:hypothetical protein
MLRTIASSISSSLGSGFSVRSAAAAMICPDWQYPHCGTSSSIQALWTAPSPWGSSPSMVVIAPSATRETRVMHERTGEPSTWTVHAPQRFRPHPYLVPVSPSRSRRTHSRGMSSGASTSRRSPLIRRGYVGIGTFLGWGLIVLWAGEPWEGRRTHSLCPSPALRDHEMGGARLPDLDQSGPSHEQSTRM